MTSTYGTSSTVYGRLPKTADTVDSLSSGTITFVSALLGTAAGVLTGNPVIGHAVYGAVDAGMTSANAGDSGKVVVGKTLAGGALGALGGGITGLLGKSKPIISFLAGTGVDTGIDQGMAALHGEPVTPKTIGASLLINGLFNGLGTSALPKSVSKRVSYSDVFEGELVNFNPGYTVRNTIDKDIILVQYTSSLGGSMKYWTTANYANNFSTLDDYMDSLAISNTWGRRNVVSVARIPAGTRVKHAVGTAAPQLSIPDPRPGGGIQILFEEFDPSWIIAKREIP